MSLIQRFTSQQGQTKSEAAARYRALLLRNESPRAGDEQALADVMAVLGRAAQDLPADLALATALARCEALETSVEAKRAEWERCAQERKSGEREAGEVIARAQREIAEATARTESLVHGANAAHHLWKVVERELAEQRKLAQRWQREVVEGLPPERQ